MRPPAIIDHATRQDAIRGSAFFLPGIAENRRYVGRGDRAIGGISLGRPDGCHRPGVKAMVARVSPNAGRVDVLVANAEGKLGGEHHRASWCKRRIIACGKVAFHRARLRRGGAVRRLDSQCFFSFASTCTFCASCVGEKTSASTCCGRGKTPAAASGGGGETSTTTPTRTSDVSRSSCCE